MSKDRSLCLRVNSISGKFMSVNFNDFWGKGACREQLFLFSISAFNCQVINFTPVWIKANCTQQQQSVDNTWGDQGALNSVNTVTGDPTVAINASRCYRYILKYFDALQLDRTVRNAVMKDLGVVGVSFLKCLGRPDEPFRDLINLMVHQLYWKGGPFHSKFQTSACTALPVARIQDLSHTLFQALSIDQTAAVVAAFDQGQLAPVPGLARVQCRVGPHDLLRAHPLSYTG